MKTEMMCKTFQEAVAEIYAWVDEQITKANPRCEISGRCCRFREYGHKLYITRPEANLLFKKKLPAEYQEQDGSLLSEMTETEMREAVSEKCLYQEKGLCTARENRPLGCRIYFCDPSHEEKSCQITEMALNRLKKVHEKFDKPWEYNELAHFFVDHFC